MKLIYFLTGLNCNIPVAWYSAWTRALEGSGAARVVPVCHERFVPPSRYVETLDLLRRRDARGDALVAHSSSASAAYRYAETYPDAFERVVFMDPVLHWDLGPVTAGPLPVRAVVCRTSFSDPFQPPARSADALARALGCETLRYRAGHGDLLDSDKVSMAAALGMPSLITGGTGDGDADPLDAYRRGTARDLHDFIGKPSLTMTLKPETTPYSSNENRRKIDAVNKHDGQ